jgi:dihydroxy-acid dehydratase
VDGCPSYSLPSRDLIADSIETVMRAQWYDGLIAIPGCDKNMPGCVMAMGRLNRLALMVYGGTIRAGCSAAGRKLDIISAFQSYREYLAGPIDEEERRDTLRRACPGAGACGGMYTANTMATAIEVLGMTLPTATQGHARDAGQVCSVRQICIRGLRNGRVGPRACSARSSSAIHTVTLPRCRRLASYSGQFVVL